MEAWCSISSLYQLVEERWIEKKIDGLSEGREDDVREGAQAVALPLPLCSCTHQQQEGRDARRQQQANYQTH